MNNEIQTIHYCTILSAGQWDYLLEGRFSAFRQKCLYRLMTDAVRTRTAYKIKGIDIVLEVGDSFNRLGMLTTRTNNRTSVHSLHFLTGWYVGGVLITNPHYVRPSATAKGQTDDVRTPLPDSQLSENEPGGMTDDCHTKGKEADSLATDAAVLSSSLLLSGRSIQSADAHDSDSRNTPSDVFMTGTAANPHIIDSGNGASGENGVGSHSEAQGGTHGSEATPA